MKPRLKFWRARPGEATMGKKHDWNKEQPHHAKTGKITKRKYAEEHPDKVEWVKEKSSKKSK